MTPFHHLTPGAVPADAALIWPWAPNWATLPVERLEWKTSIHTSQASLEQRRALRQEPRLQMSYSHLLSGPDTPLALSLLRAWHGKVWAAPAWWAASARQASSDAATLVLSRPTATLWAPGSRGMVYTSPSALEAFTVASVAADRIVLVDDLVGSWPAGARVVPLHFADLPEGQAATAPVGELLRLDVTFSVRPGLTPVLEEPADGNSWGEVFPSGTASADPRDHLLGLEHNWIDESKLTVSFPNDISDTGLGRIDTRPMGARSSLQWSVRLLLEGDTAIARLRQFVAAHRGRSVGFYALNPVIDTDAVSLVDGVAEMPSLRFYNDPAGYVAGLSYLQPKYRPRTLLFEMPGPEAVDITGQHVVIPSGAVSSGVTFGVDGRAVLDPPVVLSGGEWHLWFRSSRGGALSTGDSSGAIQVINVYSGLPDTDIRRFMAGGSFSGTGSLVTGVVAPDDIIRLSVTDSGTKLSLYSNDALLDTVTGAGFSLNLSALAATPADSAQQYLNATLYGIVAGVGPLVQVGYERANLLTAIQDSSTLLTTSDDSSGFGQMRLVSPVRLASDSVEISHHAQGVAEAVLPLVTTAANPRFGLLLTVIPGELGWPGDRLYCVVEGTSLVGSGILGWGAVPDTWGAWATWSRLGDGSWDGSPLTWAEWDAWGGSPAGLIQYEHTVVDAGSIARTYLMITKDTEGDALTEVSSGGDGSTFSGWARITGMPIVARYFKVRVTVSGSFPILHNVSISLYR
jgi:hypothetical protein